MKKRYCISALVAMILAMLLPAAAFANAAEPPCLTVLVSNPPEDLSIQLQLPNGTLVSPQWQSKGWESYYRFYRSSLHPDQAIKDGAMLQVESGGKSNTYPLTADALTGYNALVTLDVSAGTLSPGQPWLRTPLLVALRVALTLVIEGLVFFAFGYRKAKDWAWFFAINLVTQGLLNLAITGPLLGSYWFFGYGLGEVLVFAAEVCAFCALARPGKKRRAALYALVANAASLVLGGWFIASLPV